MGRGGPWDDWEDMFGCPFPGAAATAASRRRGRGGVGGRSETICKKALSSEVDGIKVQSSEVDCGGGSAEAPKKRRHWDEWEDIFVSTIAARQRRRRIGGRAETIGKKAVSSEDDGIKVERSPSALLDQDAGALLGDKKIQQGTYLVL